MTSSTAVGTGSGMALATVKSMITIGLTIETIVYAAIGAAVGFIVTEILKLLKKKIIK